MQRRDRGILQSLGKPLLVKVKESRVLLVGAGGIGCELLKNLVCSGFGSHQPVGADGTQESGIARRKAEIVVIDLDTIDLSNLNRQFLFRKHHIKKAKALVAKETVTQFNPAVNIDAHHANIFDAKYNVEFFEGFDLVFNALDNLAARRHVNRMCLAANVPLIESGTTGFNGQVQAIQKGVTECYDCNPKPVQKSYPICTIRSTPSQPIHSIVWAKSYLLPELFGTSESEESASDVVMTGSDDAEEVAKLKEEAEALKKIRGLMGKTEFATAVFNKVFHDDIQRLRSMQDMWQHRRPPEPLQFNALTEDSSIVKQGEDLSHQDQMVWSMLNNISVFCYSIEALSKRSQAGESIIEFDKDDKLTLDFVASAANLRSHIFDIPLKSEWEIKQMAGNIIPAIATSNALTASLCVLEAFKILRSQLSSPATAAKNAVLPDGKPEPLLGGAKTIFLASKSTERLVTPQALTSPNPQCPVCSPVYAKILLPQKGGPSKLQDLVDLLRQRIGYQDLSISVNEIVMYDADLEDNLQKPLSEILDGQANSFLSVMDDSDEPKVDLLLSTIMGPSGDDVDAGTLRLVPETVDLSLKAKKEALVETSNGTHDEVELTTNAGSKRKRDAEEELGGTAKKAKASNDEPVLVADDSGAIVLDD